MGPFILAPTITIIPIPFLSFLIVLVSIFIQSFGMNYGWYVSLLAAPAAYSVLPQMYN
jgi:hypothetical protein